MVLHLWYLLLLVLLLIHERHALPLQVLIVVEINVLKELQKENKYKTAPNTATIVREILLIKLTVGPTILP